MLEVSSDGAAAHVPGVALSEWLTRAGIARASMSEARRPVQSGGVYANNRYIADPQGQLTPDQPSGGRLFAKGEPQTCLMKIWAG